MSLDFPPSSQHSLYPQNDLDSPYNSLPNASDIPPPPHQHQSSHSQLNGHVLDRGEPMDVSDHGTYDLFSASAHSSQRFRSNNSSSSMSSSYGLGVDNLYSQSPFSDSLPQFHNPSPNPYDLMGGLPSSYSSGKPSPLTPSDTVGSLQHSAFPFGNGQPKDFHPNHGFTDVLDRRMSNLSTGSYPSDYNDDSYNGINVNSSVGLGFGSSTLPPFHDRGLSRMQQDRYPPSVIPPLSLPSHLHQQTHGNDLIRGVNPHAMHSPYDEMPSFMAPSPHVDFPLRMSGMDDPISRVRLNGAGAATDLQTFIRPYLDQYVRTQNRLAFGERTVIVMSSKVAQKSYGTEKRFLCPPPTAIMIGNSWWSDVTRRGEEPKLCPPRVVVSISGEPAPQEGSIEWTSATGKAFDVSDPPTGTTYIGRCVGKQLFISDVDEKKKKVEALVKIMAPSSDDEPERVIGTFPSRPIKVISKPSKKRQSAKNLELCINHGSTISLFHRLRSQTVSTKYLCVSGSGSSFKGSDGAPLMGLDQRSRAQTPSFIARTASWDPFIMYIVDVNKPAGGVDSPPPPPPQPEYPSPPPNAIPFTNNGSQIPIYYNQTVVLQCLTSGVVDIGETSVWTIVGTDQVRYNFYVPPVLYDSQSNSSGSFPIPSKPVTPFPAVVKYLPPDRASEAPKSNCASSRAVLAKPNPHASKMLTLYGENFSKTDPVTVFFGSEPSPYVEVRCTEVLGCLPPESGSTKRRPIILTSLLRIPHPSCFKASFLLAQHQTARVVVVLRAVSTFANSEKTGTLFLVARFGRFPTPAPAPSACLPLPTTTMDLVSIPQTVWHFYLEYLVYYKPGSWVDSAASTFRVLAFMTILPFILLTLLDVASYVIARTLGIVDATKASTSGELETSEQLHAHNPSIVVQDHSGPAENSAEGQAPSEGHPHTVPPSSYFRNPTEEEGNLQLSGVGTFSPAPSQPGSPTVQRRELIQHAHYDAHGAYGTGFGEEGGGGGGQEEAAASGAATPKAAAGHGWSAGSSSGESSFAMLDRDSGSEDAGLVLRKRTRRPGTGTNAGDGAE
ncbi:hypothetical protein BN946_scf184966.g16 [Trametes cinnabarina]|uniref:LAG1-DNAbind-domain-containing protein n=1 Tax=Pycnoporus cinnabarinus TaxID=5643 RepID=A0A060SSE1_PYCCI|nr:hypothetical protein BN946_scf184966.g16 [Trametes cinnabarina]